MPAPLPEETPSVQEAFDEPAPETFPEEVPEDDLPAEWKPLMNKPKSPSWQDIFRGLE